MMLPDCKETEENKFENCHVFLLVWSTFLYVPFLCALISWLGLKFWLTFDGPTFTIVQALQSKVSDEVCYTDMKPVIEFIYRSDSKEVWTYMKK